MRFDKGHQVIELKKDKYKMTAKHKIMTNYDNFQV